MLPALCTVRCWGLLTGRDPGDGSPDRVPGKKMSLGGNGGGREDSVTRRDLKVFDRESVPKTE